MGRDPLKARRDALSGAPVPSGPSLMVSNMESIAHLSRDGLAGALASAGLNPNQAGALAARHLLGDDADEARVRRLGDSLRVTVNAVLKAPADLLPVRRDRAEALAAALHRRLDDLTAARLWGLREAGDDDRLIAPGGVLTLSTTEGGAWWTGGVLMGAHGTMPARIATAAPASVFVSDRVRWIADNFDDLDADERDHVTVVNPTYDYLRVLMRLDAAATSPYPDERRLAVEIGLVERSFNAPELADVGKPAAIALDVLEQAHDLAARRLRCERLRDQAAPVFDQWRDEERNLREAVERIRALVETA